MQGLAHRGVIKQHCKMPAYGEGPQRRCNVATHNHACCTTHLRQVCTPGARGGRRRRQAQGGWAGDEKGADQHGCRATRSGRRGVAVERDRAELRAVGAGMQVRYACLSYTLLFHTGCVFNWASSQQCTHECRASAAGECVRGWAGP